MVGKQQLPCALLWMFHDDHGSPLCPSFDVDVDVVVVLVVVDRGYAVPGPRYSTTCNAVDCRTVLLHL